MRAFHVLLCIAAVALPGSAPVHASDKAIVIEPAEAVQTPKPTPRPSAKAAPTPELDIINIVIDKATTAAAENAGTTRPESRLFVPERYRLMDNAGMRREIRQLQESAAKLPADSPERERIDGLVRSLQTRMETGILPDDLVEQITEDVAELRGLKVLSPVKFRIIDQKELRTLLDMKLEEEFGRDYLPGYEFVLKLLGGIPNSENLRSMIVSLLSEQIAGLYDEKTGVLYILKQFDLGRSLARVILSHEICHALQDQHYKLGSLPLKTNDNDDLEMAVASVIEGDATILMQDYARQTFTGRDILQLVDILKIDQTALNRVPHFIRQQLIFPYMNGSKFLMQIMMKNPAARDKAFRKHPLSTEQVLHPDKFDTGLRDDPTSFSVRDLSPMLGTGWKRQMRNGFGELQVRLLFENWREWDAATVASEGWDGDQYAVYRSGKEFLFAWASVWDTPEDAREFFNAISDLMQRKRYRELFSQEGFKESDTERELLHPSKDQPGMSLGMRFRLKGSAVVVLAANSDATWQQFHKLMDKVCEDLPGLQSQPEPQPSVAGASTVVLPPISGSGNK